MHCFYDDDDDDDDDDNNNNNNNNNKEMSLRFINQQRNLFLLSFLFSILYKFFVYLCMEQ